MKEHTGASGTLRTLETLDHSFMTKEPPYHVVYPGRA